MWKRGPAQIETSKETMSQWKVKGLPCSSLSRRPPAESPGAQDACNLCVLKAYHLPFKRLPTFHVNWKASYILLWLENWLSFYSRMISRLQNIQPVSYNPTGCWSKVKHEEVDLIQFIRQCMEKEIFILL